MLVFIFLFLACFTSLAIKSQNKYPVFRTGGPNVCFRSSCFMAEVASTTAEQQKGLMGRKTLAQNRGMLFEFDNIGDHPMWMKNTLIPLDIIWLDENKKIVFIEKNALPCAGNDCANYVAVSPAKFVLEVNAGAADTLKLKNGDTADFLNVP